VSSPLAPGTTLALAGPAPGATLRVRVVRPLDSGENSATFLARDEAGEAVVLKAPRDWSAGAIDADLRVEERVLRAIGDRADRLVQLRGSGDVAGKRVVAFERLHPGPLVVLARPEVRAHFPDDPGTRWYPLPTSLALAQGHDLLAAVAQVHARGFIHDDVKPSNFMLRVAGREDALPPDELLSRALRGRVRGVLIDFGGARSLEWFRQLDRGEADADARLVPPQLTPLYAPPEALAAGPGARTRHHPSLDVYAAAMVVYAFVTGRSAYDHLRLGTESVEGLRQAKASEGRGEVSPFAWEAVAGAPGLGRSARDLWALLSDCTHRDPQQRPGAVAARDRLEELRRRHLASG
jgi:serine/threonine protein kinase